MKRKERKYRKNSNKWKGLLKIVAFIAVIYIGMTLRGWLGGLAGLFAFSTAIVVYRMVQMPWVFDMAKTMGDVHGRYARSKLRQVIKNGNNGKIKSIQESKGADGICSKEPKTIKRNISRNVQLLQKKNVRRSSKRKRYTNE